MKTSTALPARVIWGLVGAGVALAAAEVARRSLHEGWEAVTDEEPPRNPVSPDVEWRQAIVWSLATGVVAGLARLTARRAAAAGWVRATGKLPPL